jgi:U3 small nucleolar RNA-associated protein 10
VKLHLSILDSTVEKVSKAAAVRLSSNINALCLLVMDLRRMKASDPLYSDADILDAETTLNEIMIKMIYKLNDKCFRPIFARMVEWSNDDSVMDTGAGKSARQTALFGFTEHFFETLKSIVTSYSGFIVEGVTEVLQGAGPTKTESALLWNRAISTLTASFEHDQDEFWQSPARFGSVVLAVTEQLDRGIDPELASKAISCVSALATAADSPDNMKVINTAILERFRHRDQAIRLTAVKCEQALTESLGEEWLGLLPEMLPFISEAMEDDDDQVETETRRWVGQIEEILGESLDPMLQ